MQKRARRLLIFNITFLQIFLLITTSFAFSFILSQNVVSAADTYNIYVGGSQGASTANNVNAQSSQRLDQPSVRLPTSALASASGTSSLGSAVSAGASSRDFVLFPPESQYYSQYGWKVQGNNLVDVDGNTRSINGNIEDILKQEDGNFVGNPAGGSPFADKFFGKGSSQFELAKSIDYTKPITSEQAKLLGFEKAEFVDGKNILTDSTGKETMLDSTGATASGGTGYSYKILGIETENFFYGNLLEGVTWAVAAATVIQLVGRLAGAEDNLVNTATIAAVGGIMAGKIAYGLYGNIQAKTGVGGYLGTGLSPIQAGLIGVGVAAVIFIILYKEQNKQLVSFQCLPWEPPIGGSKCEECNKDPFRPCSEYRCKSLGQACQLLNPGTADEKCAWVNPKDVNSPTITPWTDALKPSGLQYIPDTSIRPPALGVKIVKGDSGCLQAFTPLEFGINNNEPAQCKIDYNHTSSFEQMQYYFGENNYFLYNHTQKMRLPGPEAASGQLSPLLSNDGTFSLYVRCMDANGNQNVDEYAISFCVDKGPDTTPPVIEKTSILSGGYVQYNADQVPIDVYVNEPAECKWSIQSKAYEDMENSMSCSTQQYQINSDLLYTCSGNLTGIENRADNKFYFRCKDQPDKPDNERNVNVQSYELILKGSQPLDIISVEPNETITGSTSTIDVNLEVETSNGAEEGKSTCYFSTTGITDSYITMFETNSHQHRQTFSLVEGGYNFFVRCIDAGGNLAESSTNFSVEVDKKAPEVSRAYKQEGLKIVTNEDAECTYSLTSCNFVLTEGIKMIYSNPDIKNNHFAEWKPTSTYYIKCRDAYDNQPNPNECSIIANAIEISSEI